MRFWKQSFSRLPLSSSKCVYPLGASIHDVFKILVILHVRSANKSNPSYCAAILCLLLGSGQHLPPIPLAACVINECPFLPYPACALAVFTRIHPPFLWRHKSDREQTLPLSRSQCSIQRLGLGLGGPFPLCSHVGILQAKLVSELGWPWGFGRL